MRKTSEAFTRSAVNLESIETFVDVAQALHNEFPEIPFGEIVTAVSNETEYQERGAVTSLLTHALASQKAHTAIRTWIHVASMYQVDTADVRDIARFISEYRQPQAWAILTGKALKVGER